MKAPVRILYISSEIVPYVPTTPTAIVGRYMPQAAQEAGMEIRSFMPKYGIINERRNQLHEVIRLSGMNIVVNDLDRPLVIKVASIAQARMQVYFIENEDYSSASSSLEMNRTSSLQTMTREPSSLPAEHWRP